MLAPAVISRAGRQRASQANVFPLPSPEGGLNARDALDQMPITDAVELTNWFPDFGRITTRRGFTEHAVGVGSSTVETLADYQAGLVRKLLAAGDGSIYDVTTAGTGVSLASGFTSNRWQTAILNGDQGWVNGVDAPQLFNGTTVAAMTVSGTGLTVTNLVGVHVFKNISFFWETDSADFWYSALSTMGGVLTKFPLNQVAGIGGRIVNVVSWTRDGGDGPDDLIAFILSSGAVAVYQGIDPGADFSIIGVFQIGEPVNIRGTLKVGGDAILVTRDGYAPLSRALPSGRSARGYKVGDKIVSAAIKQVAATAGQFGWQLAHYPEGRYMLVNYPRNTPGKFDQHVVNLETGAWCTFTGMDASCWAHHDNKLFFGADAGRVFQADTGTNDNGSDIVATARQAFTWCGARGARKQLTAVRVILESDAAIPLELSVDKDFALSRDDVDPVLIGEGEGSSLWDVAQWDVSLWADDPKPKIATLARGRIGDSFGLRLRIATKGQSVSWNGSHLIWRRAGIT